MELSRSMRRLYKLFFRLDLDDDLINKYFCFNGNKVNIPSALIIVTLLAVLNLYGVTTKSSEYFNGEIIPREYKRWVYFNLMLFAVVMTSGLTTLTIYALKYWYGASNEEQYPMIKRYSFIIQDILLLSIASSFAINMRLGNASSTYSKVTTACSATN